MYSFSIDTISLLRLGCRSLHGPAARITITGVFFMRLKVCAAAFLLLAVCFPINLSAQTEANPKFGNRDVAALAVVEQTLATMGGNAAITQLRDCVTRGNLVRPAGVVTPGGDFTWKNSGDEFRYEHKG